MTHRDENNRFWNDHKEAVDEELERKTRVPSKPKLDFLEELKKRLKYREEPEVLPPPRCGTCRHADVVPASGAHMCILVSGAPFKVCPTRGLCSSYCRAYSTQ